MRISHETIYQALFAQGRGALRRDLSACLRSGRALRVPQARVGQRGKGFVSSEILISERPAEDDDRAVPGHWEGDIILGLGSSAIGTLVDAPRVLRCCCTCRAWKVTVSHRASKTDQRWRGTAPRPCGNYHADHRHVARRTSETVRAFEKISNK